ncbi:MAG: ABC transporter permease [Campylobacterota bacterium]|nr:ABC transporter permease [Campylobacterota bacterium]
MNSDITIAKQNNNSITLNIAGDWQKNSLSGMDEKFHLLLDGIEENRVIIDFKGANLFDSAGMILITKYIALFIKNGCDVTFINMDSTQKALLLFYRKNQIVNKVDRYNHKKNIFHKCGKFVYIYFHSFITFLNFIGESFYFFIQIIKAPSKIRFKAIAKQIDTSGIQALPIVILTSFLIGLVIAYQGADQLREFGANIFIVELVTISIVRELAPMITAIVIAGRSASAFTAQIGTMKITQEIDAMKTMGFEPSIFLVQPRVVALMITLPLIVFLADLIGIFGGMVVASMQLDITYNEFIQRIYTEVEIRHFLVGIIKAPIFGFIIAVIGCYRGFQVTGSTESIGKFTTKSVVNAIFWVIVLNALFSIIFTQVGV